MSLNECSLFAKCVKAAICGDVSCIFMLMLLPVCYTRKLSAICKHFSCSMIICQCCVSVGLFRDFSALNQTKNVWLWCSTLAYFNNMQSNLAVLSRRLIKIYISKIKHCFEQTDTFTCN